MSESADLLAEVDARMQPIIRLGKLVWAAAVIVVGGSIWAYAMQSDIAYLKQSVREIQEDRRQVLNDYRMWQSGVNSRLDRMETKLDLLIQRGGITYERP